MTGFASKRAKTRDLESEIAQSLADEIAKEMINRLDVYKCNVDENPETPSQYMVRGIPAMMIFKDGKLIDSKVGGLPKNALIEWINKTIG